MEEVLKALRPDEQYFWATHNGAELDLLAIRDGIRIGFEIKFKDAPTLTRSMTIAMEDLGLEKLWVIYPGGSSYKLADKIECIGLEALHRITGRS